MNEPFATIGPNAHRLRGLAARLLGWWFLGTGIAGLTAGAGAIFEEDFSDSSAPGWHRSTQGEQGFHDRWSIDTRVEEEAGRRYGRFVLSVPEAPSKTTTRWQGGVSNLMGEFVSLPPVWELSFAVSLEAAEPIRVSFLINDTVWPPPPGPGPRPRPPGLKELLFWVTPAGPGWQTVTLTQADRPTIGSVGGGSRRIGTQLRISLASHGPDGAPLSLSRLGDHVFLLDSIRLSLPGDAGVALVPQVDDAFSVFHSGRLQSSGDLRTWTTLPAQPTGHTLIIPDGPRRFFRARGN